MGEDQSADRFRAIDTVGPKEIARAFEMKETAMSRRGIGSVAAIGGGIKNYGEKKIIGYAEDGEGVSLRMQHADEKKVLGSVRKMNLGGNVVVLDGSWSSVQNKETNEKTRINYDQGQYVVYIWAPMKEGEVAWGTEKALKGKRFEILAAETEDQLVFTRWV